MSNVLLDFILTDAFTTQLSWAELVAAAPRSLRQTPTVYETACFLFFPATFATNEQIQLDGRCLEINVAEERLPSPINTISTPGTMSLWEQRASWAQ